MTLSLATESLAGAAGDLEWNYVKFLLGRDGLPRKRFNSLYNPIDFEGDVSVTSVASFNSLLVLSCYCHAMP